MKNAVSRPMLERLPLYAAGVEEMVEGGIPTVSASRLARYLKLGEVQVRKELALVSKSGKPRVGYDTKSLLADIRRFMVGTEPSKAVIVGAGRPGCALPGYDNFENVGVYICAAFDITDKTIPTAEERIYSLDRFLPYCRENDVKIGIITVPASGAQEVCDLMVKANIQAIWNFAPIALQVPEHISVINENLAVSLSQLKQQID